MKHHGTHPFFRLRQWARLSFGWGLPSAVCPGYSLHMRIGVYGLGRFGAFWASILTGLGNVCAYNRSPRPVPEGVVPVTLQELASCDVVFLCSAISSMPEVCGELAPLLKPETLVIDTCSVKVFPVRTMLSLFPPGVSIIASHPMFGPDSARGGVRGLPLVLCPVRSGQECFDSWTDRFSGMGMKVIVMTPEQHDREASTTQGITHLIGRLLAEMELKPSEIATLGYRKLSEVMEQTCNDPWQLFVDLQRYNPFTANMRKDLRSALETLLARLDAEIGEKDRG